MASLGLVQLVQPPFPPATAWQHSVFTPQSSFNQHRNFGTVAHFLLVYNLYLSLGLDLQLVLDLAGGCDGLVITL